MPNSLHFTYLLFKLILTEHNIFHWLGSLIVDPAKVILIQFEIEKHAFSQKSSENINFPKGQYLFLMSSSTLGYGSVETL